MDTLWGETVAAPAERVTAVSDGDMIDVAGFRFEALDTPGHAWHHHVYRLNDIAFSGDAAGVRLTGTQIIDLPAPPPEFKLEVWLKTLDRLQALNFKVIYPTHFGRVQDVDWQLNALRALLLEATEFVRVRFMAGMERDQIVVEYAQWLHDRARAQGADEQRIRQYETANPSYMSVDGILRYWQRKKV
jgi:glyoxylase-like metal-dependent hydrolase (beta-lactamase superfamily II)